MAELPITTGGAHGGVEDRGDGGYGTLAEDALATTADQPVSRRGEYGTLAEITAGGELPVIPMRRGW